jgi:hypothetical protein
MSPLHWNGRAERALDPAGLVACGPVAQRVLAVLRERSVEQLQGLSVVATRDMLVVLGSAAALPWVDGVRYCAPDPTQRMLWLPTHSVPGLPLDLVLSNLLARGARLPFLLWNEPEQVLSLDQSTPLNHARLDWLQRELA